MRIFLKAWVAIIIALITAISLGLSTLNILPKAPWSLIALISFIIFVCIVIWGLFDRDRQIERLKDAKPKIEILSEVINHQAELAIKNVGGDKAEFEAEVQFISTNDMVNQWKYPKSFRCRWEDPTKERAQIQADKTRRILIATFEKISQAVSLKFHPLTEEGSPFEVANYMPGCQPPLPIPEIIFKVTITSSPKAINSPFSKTFRISPLDIFEEVILPSTSHKKGSQT